MAALLLWGLRFWPAIFVADFAAYAIFGQDWRTGDWAVALTLATLETLEVVVAAFLLRKWAGGSLALRSRSGLMLFWLVVVCVTASSTAAFITITLRFGWIQLAGPVWLLATWASSTALLYALGAAVVTPPILLLAQPTPEDNADRSTGERVALAVTTVLVCFGLLGAARQFPILDQPIIFLCLPVAGWSATRFGQRTTSLLILALTAAMIAGALLGRNGFAPGAIPVVTTAIMQFYVLAVVAFAALMGGFANDLSRATANLQRSQERLRVSRDLLANAERSAHYGSFEIDVPTMNIRISDGFKAIFGLPPESDKRLDELTGMVVEEDRQAAFDVTKNALTTVGSIYFKYRLRRADGEVRPFDVHMETVAGPDGKPARVIGIAHDLTEQVNVAEAARESEARFAAFFHNSLLPFAITRLADGTYLEINDAFTRTLGWTREDVLGRKPQEIGLLPDAATRAKAVEGVTKTGRVSAQAARLRAKDGRFVDVLVSMTKIRAHGTDCIAAGLMDVTQQQEAQDRLRESEERFSAIFQNSLIPLLLTRASDGKHLEVNDAYLRAVGWSREEVIGKTSVELGILPSPAERTNVVHKMVTTANPAGTEVQLTARDGHKIDVVASVRPVCVAGEDCYATAIMDVTARNRAEAAQKSLSDALAATNQDLEAFSYSVSHDLRAPLRSMSGFAQILREDHAEELSGAARHNVDMIVASSREMGQLIEDLLAFSRLGKQALAKQSVDPGPLVREVYAGLKPAEPNRVVDFRVGKGMPPCEADPSLLKQVFVNLLSNALKYSRKRAAATIEVGWDPTRAAYFVRDNGVGFDMKDATKLFGVFQRLHRAEDYEGTGVGLALVRRIVGRHGGRVWAEAEADKGATFFFTLAENGTGGSPR